MKHTTFILTAATIGLGALLATATLAHGPGGNAGQSNGSGYGFMQGQGGHMGGGMMQGQGHMQGAGYGPGAGFDGDCQTDQALTTPLTVDDVRANLEKRIEWKGNERLKVGKVEAKDDKTIIAEIVTVDDSLVRRVEIDKATGRHTPVK